MLRVVNNNADNNNNNNSNNNDDDDDDDDDDNNNINLIERRNSGFCTISSLGREQSPTRTLKWTGRNLAQITCAYHVQFV